MGIFSSSDPLLNATASFPKATPSKDGLPVVVNGELNKILISLKNQQTNDLTLLGVTGSVHDPRLDWKLLRNTSDHRFKNPTPILASSSISFPYKFHSEFKAGQDYGLTIYVDGLDYSQRPFRTLAYNSTVAIVEPPSSFLDPGLLFLWILFASVLALVGLPYLKTYFPATPTSKGSKKGKKASSSSHGASSASTLSSSPSEKVIVPAQAGKPYPASTQPYEEEWIPANLLKKGKKVGFEAVAAVSGSSGDEKNGSSDANGGVKKRKGGKK